MLEMKTYSVLAFANSTLEKTSMIIISISNIIHASGRHMKVCRAHSTRLNFILFVNMYHENHVYFLNSFQEFSFHSYELLNIC